MTLSTATWARAADLFASALDVEPAARERFLREACATDADAGAVYAAVQRLLRAHHALEADAGDDPQGWREAAAAASADWIEHEAGLPPGSLAGPFRIEREIGAGGMGRVYLGVREIDGAQQRVALKVAAWVRPGPTAQQRLRRERRLLATLEHPNIARLIDAGELASGQPYFAMEYVDGEALTDYCDRRNLPLRARIELMLQVLAALEHSHQRLVLHRDLKPGNILVDAGGRPKLLDFGIAKALAGADAAALIATVDTQAFFSPASAAPEQVSGAPTTVATDVYAVGVLMYELFAGQWPLAQERNPARLAQAIAAEVPALPSRNLARLEKADPARALAIAQQRRAGSARALRRQLEGDLDAIIARCLRKEPTQRYASAERLGADLRAVLRSRPIAARRDERAYRLGKFVRRHAAMIALSAAATALAGAFVAGTVAQSRQLAAARDRAEARRVQAERVTGFMVDLLREADPANARGRDPGARELVARGARRLAEIEDPQTRAALATAIADIDLALDDLAGAARHSELALRLRQAQPDADPALLRQSYRQGAEIALARADHARAEALLDQALARLPEAPAAADERLRLLRLRASLLQAQGRLQDSLSLWERLHREHRQRYGDAAEASLQARRGFARALRADGQQARAAELLENAPAPVPLDSDDDPAAAANLYALALQRRDQGRLDEAERLAQAALRIDLKVYGERHNATAAAFNALGTIAHQRGEQRAAARHFERSLEIKRAINGPAHPKVASAEYNLGLLHHLYLDDPATAEPHLRKAVEIGQAALAPEHVNLAMYRVGWSAALHDLRQDAAARTALAPALAQLQRMPGQVLNLALARAEAACLDTAAPALARGRLASALATVRSELDAEQPRRRRLEACLARLEAARAG